jgi:hypothetical protein
VDREPLLALGVVISFVAGCGSTTLGGPCSQASPCDDGEVCDMTAPGGPVCIDADGDLDGDGIPNSLDFCNHMPGGEHDEDGDWIGDICDPCPIAPPPATPDPDGDAVDRPCDPDPNEPGDEILLFEGFNGALGSSWTATTPSAWSVGGGALTASLATIGTQDFLRTTVAGKSNLSIQAGYRIVRVEDSAVRHQVGVFGTDPRPAGTATMQCGVVRADAGAGDLIVVETNQGAMSQLADNPVGAFETSKFYRAGGYASGNRAGCAVTSDGRPLGTVQTTITPDQLISVGLTAQAVTVQFEWVIVTGR